MLLIAISKLFKVNRGFINSIIKNTLKENRIIEVRNAKNQKKKKILNE